MEEAAETLRQNCMPKLHKHSQCRIPKRKLRMEEGHDTAESLRDVQGPLSFSVGIQRETQGRLDLGNRAEPRADSSDRPRDRLVGWSRAE